VSDALVTSSSITGRSCSRPAPAPVSRPSNVQVLTAPFHLSVGSRQPVPGRLSADPPASFNGNHDKRFPARRFAAWQSRRREVNYRGECFRDHPFTTTRHGRGACRDATTSGRS
jgi:hypothetical protein